MAKALREARKYDRNSVQDDNPAEHILTAFDEIRNFKGIPEEVMLMLFCKMLPINYQKLTEDEKLTLSAFLINPTC